MESRGASKQQSLTLEKASSGASSAAKGGGRKPEEPKGYTNEEIMDYFTR